MKLTLKNGIIISLFGLLVLGTGVALNPNNSSNILKADSSCLHVGNHYEGVAPTSESFGIHEYWVCCKCHEHFLSVPEKGTWNDAGIASLIDDPSDDRYLTFVNASYVNGFVIDEQENGEHVLVSYEGDEKDVVIPEGVTVIDDKAFKDNKDISSVEIPKGVTSIGASSFQNSTVEEVTLPDTLKEIGKDAFKNSDVKGIIIPSSCTKIEDGAFANCDNLEYIVIPSSVQSIGKEVFNNESGNLLVNLKIVIYVELTEREATRRFGENWNVSKKILFGFIPTAATTYYKGEWKYDSNGVPKPTK